MKFLSLKGSKKNIRKKYFLSFYFQAFDVFWRYFVPFWVIPRRLRSNSRRFGTHCRFHLHRQVNGVLHYFIHLPMKMEPIVSSETSAIRHQTSRNYPKKEQITFKIRRKLGYKNLENLSRLLNTFLFLAPPPVDLGLLIHEVSKLHPTTHTTVGRTPLYEWSARCKNL